MTTSTFDVSLAMKWANVISDKVAASAMSDFVNDITTPMSTVPIPGGSNYVMASIGAYKWEPTPANWANSLRPVVGRYHNVTALIRSQLATMSARGQTELVVMLWYAPLNGVYTDCTYAHMVDSSLGYLCNQTAINLAALVQDIAHQGDA